MHKLRFVLMFCAVSSFILLNYQNISACECVNFRSIKTQYSGADAIIIGKIEKIEPAEMQRYGSDLFGQKIKVRVEKWFKGGNQEFITLAQPMTSCDRQFKEEDKSKSYLFYLDFYEKTNDYTIQICGRSGEVKKKSDDLSWLNGLPKSLERTRFSGVMEYYEVEPEFKFIESLAGVGIKVFNDQNTFEVATDKNGMYEIWDLPSGKYKVKPAFPKGFSLYFEMVYGAAEKKHFGSGKYDSEVYEIIVPPEGCAGIDYILKKVK